MEEPEIIAAMGIIILIFCVWTVVSSVYEENHTIETLNEVCTELAGQNATIVEKFSAHTFECQTISTPVKGSNIIILGELDDKEN